MNPTLLLGGRDDIRHCSAVIGITNGIKQSRIDHLPAPIFFGFALHRWRFRIFDLDPMRRAPGAIGRAEPLANDALTTELAGFTEYNRTALLVNLVEDDTQFRATQ